MLQLHLIIPQSMEFTDQYFQGDKNLIETEMMDLRFQKKNKSSMIFLNGL